MSAVLAAGLLVASGVGASAVPTEFGSSCVSNDGLPPGTTLVQVGRNGSAPGAPVGGVVTRWTINSGEKVAIGQKLKIVRPGAGGQLTVVGDSAEVPASVGSHDFDTRIPIAAGDLLGVSTNDANGGTLECKKSSAAERTAYIDQNDLPVGSTANAPPTEDEVSLPIRVRIEPDADQDGFGDETQDKCPTDAFAQSACPPSPPAAPSPGPSGSPGAPRPLALAVAHRGSATVRVTTDVAGAVTVKGTVALGGGASTKLRGGTKSLAAGQNAPFTLKFTKALKAKLAELPPKARLKLKITATAVSPTGAVGTKRLTVKLPGQA